MILKEIDDVNEVVEMYSKNIDNLALRDNELKKRIKNGESSKEVAIDELTQLLLSNDGKIFLIKHAGVDIGFVILNKNKNTFKDESLYIQTFYIEKKWKRKGFGRSAIKLLVQKFPEFSGQEKKYSSR